jgi:hypothetical protein
VVTVFCRPVVQFRLCSVVFEGYDTTSFSEQREMKRQTLQEIVAYYDMDSKLFMHSRVLDDVMTMVSWLCAFSGGVVVSMTGRAADTNEFVSIVAEAAACHV